MIAKITRGADVGGMVRYLFGPGAANEHHDQHLVAGFRLPAELEPVLDSYGKPDLGPLISLLRQPMTAMGGPGFDQPVWHCSLRAAPADRFLSDEEWADIAEDVLHRVGIVPRGDDAGCRWIAVRHADDHVHLVVTLAREDGHKPRLWNDKRKVREACRAVEERYGLRRTAPADRTAASCPTRAETEKATRQGRSEEPRKTLRRTVATAAAGACDLENFFARLEQSGALVEKRLSVRNPSEVTGYKVGLPGDLTKDGGQIWFSGGKLAPDLTAPKLRQRWADPSRSELSSDSPRHPERRIRPDLTQDERAAIYKDATRATARATQQFRWTSDPRVRADIAAATADTLHMAAHLTGNRHLAKAADAYDRAAREPYGHIPAQSPYGHSLRGAVQLMARAAGPAARRAFETTLVLADLIISLIGLVEAIAEHREAQRREAQAAAARNAADRLRAASRPDAAEVTGVRTLSPVALAATDFPDLPMSKLPGMASPEPAAVLRPGPASDSTRSRGRSR